MLYNRNICTFKIGSLLFMLDDEYDDHVQCSFFKTRDACTTPPHTPLSNASGYMVLDHVKHINATTVTFIIYIFPHNHIYVSCLHFYCTLLTYFTGFSTDCDYIM